MFSLITFRARILCQITEHKLKLHCQMYTVRLKKEPIFFCVLLFQCLTETGEFTYTKESISYNSLYLILACVKNFV